MGSGASHRLRMIGTSPPGPTRCGSTICNTKPAAAAASKALPPRSSTDIATVLAIQWVVATAPKVPRISGRVVNSNGIGDFRDDTLRYQPYAVLVDLPNSRGRSRPHDV